MPLSETLNVFVRPVHARSDKRVISGCRTCALRQSEL